MAKIVLLPAAEADYQEALAWYHARSERAATRFEEAVERALIQITEAPARWPLCDPRHRLHRLKRYPYSIVYRSEGGSIVVVAVAHAKRRPGYWQERQ